MNELEAYKLEGLSHLSHIPSRISILRLAIWGGRLRWREQWSKACGMVIMTIPHPLDFPHALVVFLKQSVKQIRLQEKFNNVKDSVVISIECLP